MKGGGGQKQKLCHLSYRCVESHRMAGRGLQKVRKEAQSARYTWVLVSIRKEETGKKQRKKK